MNIKEKLIGGIIWKGLERVGAQTVSVIVEIVLARILVPDDYVVVSIVTIFFAFCNLFISSGLNTALVQKKDADRLDYSTVLVVNVIFACLIYLIMFFSAPIIADIYKKPIVMPVIRVMGLTFFVNAYKAVLCAKITSDMEFRKFFVSTSIGTVISAVVGIKMAKSGFGAWALVAQQMTNSIIDMTILSATVHYHIGLRFSAERFKTLFDFGGKLILASVITTVYDECRPLIVGIRFNSTNLAYYQKGRGLPSLLNSIGNNTLSSTLFPVMSKVQDDKEELLCITRRFIKTSSFIVFPMMAGMAAMSETFVRVILTDKWLPIIPYMMIFCPCYAFDLLQIGNIQVIRAMGRSDVLLKTEIIKKTVYFIVILIFVFASDSPIALAGSSVIATVWATVVNTRPTKKLLGYKYRYQLLDLWPNLITTLIMFGCVYAMNFIMINQFLLFALQVVTGVVVFISLNIAIKNETLFYFVDTIKEIRKRKEWRK